MTPAQRATFREAALHASESGAIRFQRIDNLGRHVKLKLSPPQVADIRRRVEAGEKLLGIAAEYGVSLAYVSMIGSGQRRSGSLS